MMELHHPTPGADLHARPRVLIVHVPKRLGGVNEIMYMPMGLFSVADALSASGYDAELVHLGIEQMHDRRFSLPDFIAARRPLALMFDLHWHHQTAAVLGTAYQVKRRFADLPIVLGGLTASYFHAEVIERLLFVDVVVRGDGEQPAVALMNAIAQGGALGEVANLTFRRQGEVITTQMSADSMGERPGRGLTHLGLMRHAETYLQAELYRDFSDAPGVAHRLGPAFCYNPGRGCAAHCVFCGGSAAAQRITSGRRGHLFYPDDQVIEDLRALARLGVTTLRTSFDPEPERVRYLALFDRIRSSGLKLRVVFDLWSPPTPSLIDAFAATFQPGSILVFSPESGSARVRERTRGFDFSNEDLLGWVHQVTRRGVPVHLFFTAGLPFEGPAELAQTEALIARLRARTEAQVSVAPLELDPGSAMHRHPDKLGVTLHLETLQDFYRAHKGPSRPGYRTRYLSEEEIQRTAARLRG